MSKFPVYIELKGRRAVVVGATSIAIRKARSLILAGARVVVVAKDADESLNEIFSHEDVELIKSKYSKSYLSGAVLVFASTNNSQLDEQIYKDCQELDILCNIIDVPDLCDFYAPAVIQHGDLQIAIGTGGSCPAYSGHIRKKLEKMFTEVHGAFLAELKSVRQRILERIEEPAQRKALLGKLVDDESFEYFVKNGAENWQERAEKQLQEQLQF